MNEEVLREWEQIGGGCAATKPLVSEIRRLQGRVDELFKSQEVEINKRRAAEARALTVLRRENYFVDTLNEIVSVIDPKNECESYQEAIDKSRELKNGN